VIAALHLAGAEIDFEVRNPVPGRGQGRSAARQSLEARHELPEREGFGEIVVRPDPKPAHAVVHAVERRQHEDGGRGTAAPELSAEVEAAAPGQPNVQNDHVERAPLGPVATFGERRRQRRIDALRTQAVAQQAGQLEVVFDDQHSHGCELMILLIEKLRHQPVHGERLPCLA